jgi:hypothetical protein
VILDEGSTIKIGKRTPFISAFEIGNDYLVDVQYSVTTATKKAAKMAMNQINDALN